MKKILILLLILINAHSFCQESDVFTARQVQKMAVFPGCEKWVSNEELAVCFQDGLTKQLSKDLDPQIDYFLGFRLKNLIAKIQFIVSKKGELIGIKPVIGGHSQLGDKVVESLLKYSEKLTLKPALIENNEPVNLILQLPIKFSFFEIWNKEISIFEELNAPELVYLTINEVDETYEIRLKKDLTFSVYSLKNNQEEFLGNVPNWLEFKNMEPFAKYVNEFIAEPQWELMTEGNLNGETYRIYRWSYDLEYVRVYQLVNGEEELVLKSNRFSKFKKSPYLKLLFRQ